MTTPSGTITLTNVQAELGGSSPISISEYYRNGLYVPGYMTGVPTSGQISMGQLRNLTKANFGTLVSNTSSIAEGGSVTFTLSGGVGISDYTYFYRIVGVNGYTVSASDFTANKLTGSMAISGNYGQTTIGIASGGGFENNEQFAIVLTDALTENDALTAVGYVTSSTVTINEPKSYSSAWVASNYVNEGGSIAIDVTTTNVAQGTTLYYKCIGYNSTSGSDFPAGTVGSYTVGTLNGSGQYTQRVTITTNVSTAAAAIKTFAFGLYSDSGRTVKVHESSQVTLRNVSCSMQYSSMNEDTANEIYYAHYGLPAGTTIWYTSNAVVASDTNIGPSGQAPFAGNSTGGVYTSDKTAFMALYDEATEGTETAQIDFRLDGASGPIVATATWSIVNKATGNIYSTSCRTTNPSTLGQNVKVYASITNVCIAGFSRNFDIYWSTSSTGPWTYCGVVTVAPYSASSNELLWYDATASAGPMNVYIKAARTTYNERVSAGIQTVY